MGTEGKIPFWEGQSYGIVPPGEKEMPNGKTKPHAPRLYSIASSRYGDEFDGKTTSLCVRRATYWDPEMKADDPAKKGICSNFLCDAKPGDKVMMTGPVGKALLLDESNPNNVHLQGHRVGHLPEGPQEERAVPRGGVLRRPPWREA